MAEFFFNRDFVWPAIISISMLFCSTLCFLLRTFMNLWFNYEWIFLRLVRMFYHWKNIHTFTYFGTCRVSIVSHAYPVTYSIWDFMKRSITCPVINDFTGRAKSAKPFLQFVTGHGWLFSDQRRAWSNAYPLNMPQCLSASPSTK